MRYIKTILIISLIITTLTLMGCSQIPYEEQVKFCESKGLKFDRNLDGGFSCYISDLDYVRQNIEQKYNNTKC